MSTKADEDGNPKAEEASEDKEGGLFPAILAGAGILAVVAVLALWPSGDDANGSASDAAGAKGGAGGAAGANGKGVAGKGGVQARSADEANANRRPEPKVNPAIKLPAVGMAPGLPPPEEPPVFNDVSEEIAWYERKLEAAKQMRDSRKKFADRLPRVRERIEKSEDPEAQLAAFESRKKIVEQNYEKAQKRVEELEQKLADLQ